MNNHHLLSVKVTWNLSDFLVPSPAGTPPMYITRYSNLTNRAVVDELWELYEAAYARLATLDPTRETLFRHEFDEVLADPTNRLWVLRSDDGPIAMAVVATDIGSTRYLSRAFFQRVEPERMDAGLVHYIMWVTIHPDHQGGRAAFELARGFIPLESTEGALLVFDLPESNQPNVRGGGAELLFRMAQMIGPVDLQFYGGSKYYALDFAPTATGAFVGAVPADTRAESAAPAGDDELADV